MWYENTSVALLQGDVRHRAFVDARDQRFARSGPRALEREREVVPGQLPQVGEIESLVDIEERQFVVVDIEDERAVPEPLGQNAETERGEPRLGHPDGIGVDPLRHRFHRGQVLGKRATVEEVDGYLWFVQRRPDRVAVAFELSAPDLDVEPAGEDLGQAVRPAERVVSDVPGDDGDL